MNRSVFILGSRFIVDQRGLLWAEVFFGAEKG